MIFLENSAKKRANKGVKCLRARPKITQTTHGTRGASLNAVLMGELGPGEGY
jgi:hypothetical protein